MRVPLEQAVRVEGILEKERRYLEDAAAQAPESLREELGAMAAQRREVREAITAEIVALTVPMPDASRGYWPPEEPPHTPEPPAAEVKG